MRLAGPVVGAHRCTFDVDFCALLASDGCRFEVLRKNVMTGRA